MKRTLLLGTACIGFSAAALLGQVNLGSDGSMGALTVASGEGITLTTPPDGIFHYTTIDLEQNARIKFTRNAANTPVYLLATGDITISGGVSVDLDGSRAEGPTAGIGGPGGFDGGKGGFDPGDGLGPGAGSWGRYYQNTVDTTLPIRGSASHAIKPSDARIDTTVGEPYGNGLLIPLIGGSGGGGSKYATVELSRGGGGGGGALLIGSNTAIIFSPGSVPYIHANGANGLGGFGHGSGGAIRLVSPSITGECVLETQGGASNPSEASYGRIRVDALNRGLFTLKASGTNLQQASYGSNMVVFPENFPEIRIKQIGNEVVPDQQVAPVFAFFPPGSAEQQDLRVAVTDFDSIVPLLAVVTPESGSRQTFEFEIDNSGGGTAEKTIQIDIPAGVASRIDVWTR